MNSIAIIPARSGSRGLPDKNILELCGRPLIAYSIEAAEESGCFEMVMVSTDSERYAEIARGYGAEVPFLRSPENSLDTSGTWDAVREVLLRLEETRMGCFDIVAVLQPTSPLRNAHDIKEAFEEFRVRDAQAVVSVCEVDHSPLWCSTLPADKSMGGFLKDGSDQRRQDLDKYYRINGAIYLVRTDVVLSGSDLYGSRTYAYIMPKERSVDIDDAVDFAFAETLLASSR